MRKFLISIVMAIAFASSIYAQNVVEIGDPNSYGSSSNVPITFSYNNSYSEVIYLADELMPGTINSISYYFTGNDREAQSMIYLGETPNSVYSDNYDYMSETDLTLVYSGTVSYSAGWTTITFDTPYNYTGSGNLVVAYLSNRGSWENRDFLATYSDAVRAVYRYDDNAPYSLNDLGSHGSSGTSYARPNTRFGIVPDGDFCWNVTDLAVSGITSEDATISWTSHETSTTFGIEYKLSSAEEWTIATLACTETSYILNDLLPMASYDVKVYSICGAETSPSRQITFSTNPTDDVCLTLPYNQTFDNITSLDRFTFQNGTNGWFLGTATNNTFTEAGSLTQGGALYVSNDNGATNFYNIDSLSYSYAWAIVNFVENTQNVISFDWKGVGEAYCDYFRVYLMPVGEELSTSSFPSDSYAISQHLYNATEWQNQTIVLPDSYAGNYYKLVFAWKNDGSVGVNPPAAIDNLMISSSTCLQVQSIEISAYEEDNSVSADITVNYANEEASFLVEYRQAGATEWQTVTEYSPITITGLEFTTTYQVRVTAICGNDNALASQIFEFTTPCGVIYDYPYEENFHTFIAADGSVGNAPAPMCWYNVNAGSESLGFIQYDDTGWSNVIALMYSGSLSATANPDMFNDWLITPAFSLTGAEVMSFELAYMSENTNAINVPTIDVYSYNVSDGDMESAADTSLFTYLGTITHTTTTTESELHQLSLASLNGSTRLALAIRQPARTFIVDNFQIMEAQSCPDVHGTAVVLASATTAEVSFDVANGTGEGWTVAYGTAASSEAFNPENATTTLTVGATDQLPVTISNLVAGSTYYFAVKQNCQGGEYSDVVSLHIPFVKQLPYEQAFENLNAVSEWNFTSVNDTATMAWVIGTAVNNTFNEEETLTSGGAMYVSGDNGLTNDYIGENTDIFATVYLDITPAASHTVSFDWKAVGENGWDYLKVYLLPLTATDFESNQYAITGQLYNTLTWQHKQVELQGLQGGLYKLVFRWKNDVGAINNPAAAVDNIVVMANDCSSVNSVSAFALEPTDLEGLPSVSVSINDNNEGVDYLLRYRAGNSGEWNYVSDITADDFPYIIEGLEFETSYSIAVAAICENGDTTSFTSASVTTVCGTRTAPWTDDFTSNPLGGNCWENLRGFLPVSGSVQTSTLANEGSWGYNYGTSIGDNTSSKMRTNIYGENKAEWLITPKIDLGEGVAYQISFDVAVADYYDVTTTAPAPDDRFAVLVSTDGGVSWDVANAMIFADGDSDTVHNFSSLTNTFARYTYVLADANGEPMSGIVRLAFYGESTVTNGDNYLWIDNISVEPASGCFAPTALSVIEGTLTDNAASISFTESGEATQWEYILSEGETVSEDVAEPVLFTENNLPLTLSDLSPEATYTIAIRSVCGEDIYSAWSSALTFTTLEEIEIIAPTVMTNAASAITANGATLNGSITAGNEEITSQGFMYQAEGAAEWTSVEAEGETITATLTNLTAATTYNFKAFATTASGTTEGEEMSFTTLAGLADVAGSGINAMLYPNPASDKATLSIEGLTSEAQIVVSDAQGRILFNDTMSANTKTYELNVATYAAGVYYIRIISGQSISTQKLIVR